jgi:hypothetical protein
MQLRYSLNSLNTALPVEVAPDGGACNLCDYGGWLRCSVDAP